MSDAMIVEYCSPTLAGLKTGSMFNCRYGSREEVRKDLARLNRVLRQRGLMAIPLRYSDERVLIYVYRQSALREDLSSKERQEILMRCGYAKITEYGALRTLIRRLREEGEFPHEIGLFLGYAPEDVKGFMEEGPASSLFTGTWKVYRNEEKKKKLFDQYRRCTEIYRKKNRMGRSLADLTVAR